MKRAVGIGVLVLAAVAPAWAFDDKDDLKAAAKKLADASSYSWTTTSKNNAEGAGAGGSGFGNPTIEGKSIKDGPTWISMKRGENTIEAAFKGDKFAVKVKDIWMGSEDTPGGAPQGGRPDPSLFMARMLKAVKPGAQGLGESLDKIQNLKSEGGGVYTAEFTPEGAKDQLSPKVDGQQALLNFTDTKGTIKLWVKDGMLVKVESTLQGKMMFGQREREINRTSVTEFKDIGTTKLDLPDEAKKKLE